MSSVHPSGLLSAVIILPLAVAAASVLLRRNTPVVRALSVAGSVGLLAVGASLVALTATGGIIVTHLGGWAAPLGITLVADLFSALMVTAAGAVALAVVFYARADLDERRERLGFHALFHALLAGVCGAFVTGDLFNLYVWFEVLLMASFVLLTLGGDRAQLRGAFAYVAINLVSSACFLIAVGLIYGATGTLNLADLALRVAALEDPAVLSPVALLLMVAFGIKAALFPLFFWLPVSYPTPPRAITALFAGLLTKVGVYALFRVFTLVFHHDPDVTHRLLLAVACVTMLTGVLGAAAQSSTRHILSFHIVSQIGFIVMGLAIATPLALVGAIFYLLHHIVVKTALFLVTGLMARRAGSESLPDLGGLWRSAPWLAWLFLLPALSLAGVPPLSGFWAKLTVIRAGIEADQGVAVTAALVAGGLTLYSMTKIWASAVWQDAPADAPAHGLPGGLIAPAVGLVALSLLIAVFAGPVFDLATVAAAQLLDRGAYVSAVMEGL